MYNVYITYVLCFVLNVKCTVTSIAILTYSAYNWHLILILCFIFQTSIQWKKRNNRTALCLIIRQTNKNQWKKRGKKIFLLDFYGSAIHILSLKFPPTQLEFKTFKYVLWCLAAPNQMLNYTFKIYTIGIHFLYI